VLTGESRDAPDHRLHSVGSGSGPKHPVIGFVWVTHTLVHPLIRDLANPAVDLERDDEALVDPGEANLGHRARCADETRTRRARRDCRGRDADASVGDGPTAGIEAVARPPFATQGPPRVGQRGR
jgi:hypothetical protein